MHCLPGVQHSRQPRGLLRHTCTPSPSRPTPVSTRPSYLRRGQAAQARRRAGQETEPDAISVEELQQLGIANYSYGDLKTRLREYGLPTGGKKEHLRQRLAREMRAREQRERGQQIATAGASKPAGTRPSSTGSIMEGTEMSGPLPPPPPPQQQQLGAPLNQLSAGVEAAYRRWKRLTDMQNTALEKQPEPDMTEFDRLQKAVDLAHQQLERERAQVAQQQQQTGKQRTGFVMLPQLLARPLPSTQFGRSSTGTNDKKQYPSGDLAIQDWDDFLPQVNAWLRQNIPPQDPLVDEARFQPLYRHCTSEDSSNMAYFEAAFSTTNACFQLDTPPRPWAWEKNPNALGSFPDGALKGDYSHRIVAIYEGKHPLVFMHNSLTHLPLQSTEANLSKARKIIAQAAAYMWDQGAMFGIISTYQYSFFVERVDGHTYKISHGLGASATCPSVREAIYFLSRRAIEEPQRWEPQQPGLDTGHDDSSDAGKGRGAGGGRSRGRMQDKKQGGLESKKQEQSILTSLRSLSLSKVLRATDRSCVWLGSYEGKEVAIKVVDAWKQESEVAQLQHEVTVYERLEHLQGSCVPRLIAAGFWHAGMHFVLVTEFVPGIHPDEQSPLCPTLLSAAEQALHAVHKAGVLHGDVDASNLIVDPKKMSVFILDFAFSRLFPPPSDEEVQEEMHSLQGILGKGSIPQSNESSWGLMATI